MFSQTFFNTLKVKLKFMPMFDFNQHVKGFLNAPSLKGLIKGIKDFDVTQKPVPFQNIFPEIKRLGKRAEFLFETILKSEKNIQLIESNIPLRNSDRTIGEIDFIIKNGSQVIHLELTTKFYLFDESLDSKLINQWIGPNRKDFLHLKVSKLKCHQFPIIKSNEFLEYIISRKIPIPDQQSLMFKAQLFVPLNSPYNFPKNYNDCIVGNWFTNEQFEQLNQKVFFIPNKNDWFIDPNENMQWISKQECMNQIKTFHSRKFSPMIWIKNQIGLASKAFIVWW